jgi:predicted nucleic acid-binding protein
MAVVNTALARDELLNRFTQGLVTRTLVHVAEEARLDGESLKELVERYEIDYAWHVLGSARVREATLSVLEARLARPVDAAHKVWVDDVLEAAAAQLPTDALMSFDNDVPQQLGHLLSAHFDAHPGPVAEAA